MRLADLQSAFQSAVRDATPPGALLRGRLAQRGLDAYRHAYRARLREALRDNYGVLHQAMGDADFDALANDYLAAHAPTEPSIRWFGHRLGEFMRDWPALPHPALADLARLDWALRNAFDAAAEPALDDAQLAAVVPEAWMNLVLRPQPHVRLLDLQWAVAPAWHALAAARERGGEAEVPAPEPLAHAVLVWRDVLQPRWRTLGAEEARALALVRVLAVERPGVPLGEWLEALGAPLLPQAVGWLRGWARDGVLRR